MLHLAASPWPILIFWGFILLLAKAAKKNAPPRQTLSRRPDQDGSRVELGDALQRAMEKLREAERESRRRAPSTRTEVRARQGQALKGRPAVVLQDMSSAEPGLESVVDYDEEAIQLEEKRVREAAEAFERIDAPTARTSLSAATQPARAQSRPGVLARFADGSLRGAVILSEILGRPIADR